MSKEALRETKREKLMKRTLTTQQNMQLLMFEICKAKHSLIQTFMRDVFAERISTTSEMKIICDCQ